MKTLAFGFSSVNAGQRGVTHEPQVIAVSTEGSFRLTAPVSKALGIAAGDNVMFVNNIPQVDEAIRTKHELVVKFCEEQGLDIDAPESSVAIHKAFDEWGIAKGIQEFDGKGLPKTCTERLSAKDKLKYVSMNFSQMLEAALDEENGADEQTKEALTREGITENEQKEILAKFVVPKELLKFKGSKTANTAKLSGIGIALNFTDSNVWKQLKAGMGEDATKFNRVFSVDLEKMINDEIDNGYQKVPVVILPLGTYVDKEPARIGGSDESED